jgi:hypothetical protein
MSVEPILLAKNGTEICLLPEMANRHGLIAGATGTGKTVTLQLLAESFSALGVPGFRSRVANPQKFRSALSNSSSTTQPQGVPSRFGMCLVKKVIRCGQPFRRWGRCYSDACSN